MLDARVMVGTALIRSMTDCAFTSGVVKLKYQAPPDLPRGRGEVAEGNIVDERGRQPDLLTNKINAYGQKTSGAYLSEKPVAEILQDSIREALASSGYGLGNENSPKLLTGRLMSLDFEPIMGMFTATLNARLMVEFGLRDQRTQQVIWREVVTGFGSQSSGSMFGEDYIRPAFKQAMDDMLRKLAGSETFRAALQ